MRAPAEPTAAAYVRAAREAGASGLHLSAGAIPFARIEGDVARFEDAPPLPPEAAEAICRELCGGADPVPDRDFCVDLDGRVRVNVHRHRRGFAASLKLVPREIPTLEALGLPEELHRVTEYRTGLVLVTGPAGCGKTCTLAALVRRIDETRADHIVTIEDPIEFVFESRSCNVTQRQVGPHTRSFSAALRAALREDPDVILVSELRDLETIRTAVVAAETGHLVLGTLHTRDAASTVSRLLDVFPAREQDQVRAMLAASLRTVLSQRLLPRAGGGVRVPAYELLQVTPAVAKLIRDGRTHQIPSQIQIGRRRGMVDLDTRLGEMLAAGLITRDVARAEARDPGRFGDAG